MLLIKLLLSSSSFLLLLLLLTVVAVFTLELRANFIRIIRELFAFLWGWPNITYTPEATLARLAALDLLYFARYLCNFFITIFIIYYCLPLIGYVLIFCFFFELKFKFKFVRRFFLAAERDRRRFQRLAGRTAPSWERSDRRTRRAPDRNCWLALTARCFSDKLLVDAARLFQSCSVSISISVQLPPAAQRRMRHKKGAKIHS